MRFNLIKYFKDLIFTSRCYLIGTAFGVIGVVAFLINAKLILMFEILAGLASLLFATGFAAWCSPYLRAGWASPIGRPVLALVHALVLLLAIFPAKFLVAQAMKLPPQYFEVTVGICTLLFYPAMWLLVLSFIALLLVIVFTLTSYLLQWTTLPLIDETLMLFGKAFPAESSSRNFFIEGRRRSASSLNRHSYGALVIFAFALLGCGFYVSSTEKFSPAVRWIAYAADFQWAPMYPGIDAKKRFRLMDNGVVAYAERNGWGVDITVGYFEQPKAK